VKLTKYVCFFNNHGWVCTQHYVCVGVWIWFIQESLWVSEFSSWKTFAACTL
jgi:hypothetical protein